MVGLNHNTGDTVTLRLNKTSCLVCQPSRFKQQLLQSTAALCLCSSYSQQCSCVTFYRWVKWLVVVCLARSQITGMINVARWFVQVISLFRFTCLLCITVLMWHFIDPCREIFFSQQGLSAGSVTGEQPLQLVKIQCRVEGCLPSQGLKLVACGWRTVTNLNLLPKAACCYNFSIFPHKWKQRYSNIAALYLHTDCRIYVNVNIHSMKYTMYFYTEIWATVI